MHILVMGPNQYRRAGIRRTLESAAVGVIADSADHGGMERLATGRPADVIVLDGPLPAQATPPMPSARQPPHTR